MPHRIIILTDFSKASKNAADFVLHNTAAGDEVLLYHNISHLTRFMPLDSVNAMDSYIEEIGEKLQKEKERINADHPDGHKINRIRFDIGFAANNLHRIVERFQPHLLVVGTKTDAKDHEGWLLTKYSTLALETNCPLLLVPEESQMDHLRNIICVHQSDERELRFDEILNSMFELKEPNLHLLMLEDDFEEVGNFLAPAKKTSNTTSRSEKHRVAFEDDVSGVRGYSKAMDADMIVVNADEPSFFEQLTQGDFRHELINRTQKPLLILGEQHA